MKIRWLCCGDCESDQHHWIWEISLMMFDSDWTVKRTRELALCGELFLFSLFACKRRFRYHLSLAGAATSIFVVTRQFCCCDKHVVVVTSHVFCRKKKKKVCLSRQNYFCFDKKLFFFFCRYKHTFVATKDVFCRDIILSQHIFVATNVLSRQAYFCRNKRRVLSPQTHVCHDKHVFVAWQNFCRDKNYT